MMPDGSAGRSSTPIMMGYMLLIEMDLGPILLQPRRAGPQRLAGLRTVADCASLSTKMILERQLFGKWMRMGIICIVCFQVGATRPTRKAGFGFPLGNTTFLENLSGVHSTFG